MDNNCSMLQERLLKVRSELGRPFSERISVLSSGYAFHILHKGSRGLKATFSKDFLVIVSYLPTSSCLPTVPGSYSFCQHRPSANEVVVAETVELRYLPSQHGRIGNCRDLKSPYASPRSLSFSFAIVLYF